LHRIPVNEPGFLSAYGEEFDRALEAAPVVPAPGLFRAAVRVEVYVTTRFCIAQLVVSVDDFDQVPRQVRQSFGLVSPQVVHADRADT